MLNQAQTARLMLYLTVKMGARLSHAFAPQALLLQRQSRALRSLADLDAQERARAADAVSRWQVHG